MSLEEDINDLRKKINLLEDENSSLSQNMEDLLLVNILNQHSVKDNSIGSYLDAILEKLSILKTITLVAVCKPNNSFFTIISFYSLHDDYNRLEINIDLSIPLKNNNLKEPIYLLPNEVKSVIPVLFPSEDNSFGAEIVLFPFEVLSLGQLFLILVDNDATGSRLKSLELLLNGFMQNLTIRVENIILNENLNKFNAELEEKVVERTEQLKQIIELLNSEIKEKQKKELALKENEKIQSLIFNSTPLMMLLLDEELKVIRINQKGLNISNKNEQALYGLQPGQTLNCSHNNNNKDKCGNGEECTDCFLWNSIKYTLKSHESLYKVEGKLYMGIDNNIFERNVIVTTEYIEINAKSSVFVSIDDITERVQLEEVLKEKTLILLKAQELARIGEFHHDLLTHTYRLSAGLDKILDYNKSTITAEELFSNIHTEDLDGFLKVYNHALATEDRYSINFRYIKPTGEIIHLFTQTEIERDTKGHAIKTFGVVMDITEQKKAEEDLQLKNQELQATEEELTASNDALRENLEELEKAKIKAEESDRLKSAFLANMSHEIRTPMNAIVGFSDLLNMEDMPFEKRKKFTKIIQDRSKDLMGIITDILDISRIESHTLKIVDTKGNIDNKLIEISNFFELRNEEIYLKPITFSVINRLTPEQCSIETDFERIKQVLINLIDNAFKFTVSGNIQIGCYLKDKSTLQFSVSDTGIGIPIDKQQLIFERFRQIDESYFTRDFGGSGLGLSISKGIVELMNGTIWVESQLGIGSTFYFTIPYKPCIIKDISKEHLNENKFNFINKTVLIVEDTIYNQDYIKELLGETNASLLFASNGATALELFRSNPNIDIVLMDIRLPDIHGLDLTKMMISERNNIKVIAQTAYASNEDRSKCFDAGCIDFISKPISQKTLLEMLSKYLC
ncbi:MAG: ATP-binding protein [Salinivirgaceae bacterium]